MKKLKNLPLEIINIILSFREIHPISKIMNIIIHDSYEEDYNPYYAEYFPDNYCFHYSFKEWYFRIIRIKYNKYWNKNKIYHHTPNPLLICDNIEEWSAF